MLNFKEMVRIMSKKNQNEEKVNAMNKKSQKV